MMQICTSTSAYVRVCVHFILPLIKMANDDLSIMRSERASLSTLQQAKVV